jgi:hypothetical protein
VTGAPVVSEDLIGCEQRCLTIRFKGPVPVLKL